MLNDLISLTDSLEFEEYGTLDLTGVRVEGRHLDTLWSLHELEYD